MSTFISYVFTKKSAEYLSKSYMVTLSKFHGVLEITALCMNTRSVIYRTLSTWLLANSPINNTSLTLQQASISLLFQFISAVDVCLINSFLHRRPVSTSDN